MGLKGQHAGNGEARRGSVCWETKNGEFGMDGSPTQGVNGDHVRKDEVDSNGTDEPKHEAKWPTARAIQICDAAMDKRT